MANKKGAAQEAARQAAEQQAPVNNGGNKPRVESPVINPQTKGLTPGEKVAYLTAIQTERAYTLNSENPDQAFANGMTMLAQATILDIAVSEIATGSSTVGFIITANPKNYELLQAIATNLGTKLADFKALPQPTEAQLKQAGIVNLLPTETRVVTVTKENVSNETIEKKKKEIAAAADAVDNPSKVENEAQLKSSLTAMLVKPVPNGKDTPFARVERTIKFYKGYLTLVANRNKDKEALEETKEKSMAQLLDEISKIVGPCPFAISGTGSLLLKFTNDADSIVSPFCLLRRSTDATDEQYVADVTKIILIWSITSKISECEASIKVNTKITKDDSKDSKTKKLAEAAITHNNTVIAELKDLLAKVSNPSHDAVDSLIDDYKSENKESVKYKTSHRIVSDIMKTYYPDDDIKSLDVDVMLANVQQHAGIITNMFRDPLSQSITYSESNLKVMKKAEAPASEEKPAEEAAAAEETSKN